MKVTVDRLEGEIAVLLVRPEEKQEILFPRELLPGVSEGDLLEITVERMEKETDIARERVSSLMEKLRNEGS